MPRENVNSLTDPEFRTEIGWERDKGYVQVATTNRNYTPAITIGGAPFDGWHVTYDDRQSVNRAIWAMMKARDEAFGPDAADDLTTEKAYAEAARMLDVAGKRGMVEYATVAAGWLTLARELAGRGA